VTNAATCSGLPALTSLDLSENRLTNLAGLEKLTNLTSLVLSGKPPDQLGRTGEADQPHFAGLERSLLTNLAGLEKLTNLTSLDLSGNLLTTLGRLEKLTELRILRGVPRNNSSPFDLLAHWHKLELLDMSDRSFGLRSKSMTNHLAGEIRFGTYTGKLKPLPRRICSLVFYGTE
jgi:Leucine-rich repeat (LRR) protein